MATQRQATPIAGTSALPSPGTPVPTTPGGGRRGVYITVGQQTKRGSTPNCPGCHCSDDNPKPHNKECRARFEEIIAKERAEAARKEDVEMGAGGPPSDRVGSSAPGAGGTAPKQAGGIAGHAGGTADQDQAGGTADENPSGTSRSQAGGAAGQAARGTAARPEAGGTAWAEATREAKRTRDPNVQRSQKREAYQGIKNLEDQVLSDLLAAAIADEEEVDHEEMPILHSIPLASYPELVRLEQFLDEKTGEPLEEDKVRKARAKGKR